MRTGLYRNTFSEARGVNRRPIYTERIWRAIDVLKANETRRSRTMGTLGKVAPAIILLFTLFTSIATQAIVNNKPPSCVNTPPYATVPYKAERFVSVAPGVKLELLDWGGSGEVMVLQTGSGDNAHVFDYFAFQFTSFFHVIALTRRGWLPSSQPKNGYDVETRAADDIKVLDALGIKRAIWSDIL